MQTNHNSIKIVFIFLYANDKFLCIIFWFCNEMSLFVFDEIHLIF